MRRVTALLGKELGQHAGVGIGLTFCLAGAWALLLLAALAGAETVSLMEAHAGFLIFVTLGGLVLGNRLVVAEYYGRTQLFVEALPVARWEMVALKYLLGLAFLLLAAGASLLATALVALSREPIDARFLGLVGARTGSYVFFVWAFFFAMGMLGRFRTAIYVGILLALTMVDSMTAFELQRFGPLAVLDGGTLPFEREVLPARAVAETVALGTSWTALAFVLALIHEGSVAETLARRMSLREKAVIGGLFVALTLAVAFLDERRDKEPYAFEQEEVLRSEELPLEVLYLLPERRADAEALLGRLEDDLGDLAAELGWREPPAVRVAYGPSLDPGIYDTAVLDDNDGLLVRVNFRSGDPWDPRDFSAHVLGLALDEATAGRARFEPKAWLRDGFAHWWSRRDRGPGRPEGAPTESRSEGAPTEHLEQACRDGSATLLRALWATRGEPLSEERLARWLRYRERHGEDLAEAVAFSGLSVLERRVGRDAVLRLAHRVFGRRPAENLSELFYEWRHPMADVFAAATSRPWLDFIDEWNGELERLRGTAACRERLAAVSGGEGWIEIEPGAGALRDLVYGFRFAEPPPAGTLVALLHHRLTPFDGELERRDLKREEKLWPEVEREASWRLPGFYGRGSRVFLALEVESAALGCPIRLVAERREVP